MASSIGSKKKGTKNLELQSSSPGARDVSDGSDSETECVPLDKITYHSSVCKSSPQKITGKTTDSILSSSSYSFKNGTHESHTTSGIVGIQRITTRSQAKVNCFSIVKNSSTLNSARLIVIGYHATVHL